MGIFSPAGRDLSVKNAKFCTVQKFPVIRYAPTMFPYIDIGTEALPLLFEDIHNC